MKNIFLADLDWNFLNGHKEKWGEQVAVNAKNKTEAYRKLRKRFPYDRSKKQPGIFVSKRPIKLVE